ncbi:MAG: hypothetical protein FJ290_15705 [Planctomycetes bacterium]|nr:hypothetical protein [Planctomycetota bacterium]
MSTVTIPDALVERLRALEGGAAADLDQLVARALADYVSMPEAKLLVRRAEELDAALTRAGITEEDVAEHFDRWRRPHPEGGHNLKPLDFWQVLLEVMRNPGIANFGEYYNNALSRCQARNTRPRTHVMLNDDKSVLKCVLDELKKAGLLPDGGAMSTHRYADLSYSVGNWWNGEQSYLLVVEVENDWRELYGTLRDVIRFQARMKVAVFYHSQENRNHEQEVESALHKVARSFGDQGFSEANDTGYLVVVAPDRYPQGSDPARLRCSGYMFEGLTQVDHGCWQEEALW